MIQECLDAARDLKEAFLWRILLGRILLEAGQDAMARVQFDLILETIERHQLDEWDKELALAGLRAAYMGIRAEDSESILDIRLGLLKRITRLSPLGALETLNIREP